ncbi:hypothetical protein PVAND_002029 [Polypedilum vanderplanki]|uniref:C2H2-type domain-containing protein n=1 Tax=Polypedilum vanderplanki TaxID=319348 RepID=A0A9J6BQ63_POLVA|nr:hypothetical protein PVAND_002029 [Polypedilum vanderplanki]
MLIETSPNAAADGYVPNNNSLFGSWDSPSTTQEYSSTSPVCGNNCTSLSTLHGSDFIDCGNCLSFDHTLSLTQPIVPHSSYWNDEMNSFTGLPLEMEPLPSLFPFSPCTTASYSHNRPERQTHDVADVLLSLKNAVLKPNGEPHPCHQTSSLQASQNSYGNSSNGALSYTVHHPQILLSPSSHHHYYQCHQNQSQGSYNSSNSYYDSSSCPAHNHYPSMSLNVSMNMNMTMHDYPCSQMQWNPPSTNSSASSVNVLCPPFSPAQPYPSHSYSFTADFRQPSHLSVENGLTNSNTNSITSHNNNLDDEPALETVKISTSPLPIEQKPFFNTSTCFTSPKSDSSSLPYEAKPKIMSPSNSHANHSYEPEDDSNSNEDTSAGKPNLCRLCGKTYARPSTLKTHLRTHSGERPYKCLDCKKSFSQAANLTAHVRTHTGQKPFRCPICDRRFSQSSSVTTHMRTHSGERPYRCRSCKKAFSDSSTLTKHLRIHSGEKPYQCKLCLLRFSQSGNLNRHMRVHGGNGNLLT